MGSLVKVESSAYTKDVIDIYSSNKVGTYSKYLSLTPEFVTYYSVNQVMSRTDVGTGSVTSERGYNSPLRFNKIKNLPCYNLPVLSPDITYDETGMDLELEASDVTLLPDTVKPIVPDHLIYHLPDGLQLLFRVNNFRYNTIQSNEFVLINIELKEMGYDLEEKMEPQVVKTFYTVFENIGTEEKCFIEEEAVETINGLVDLITECSEIYHDTYWDECVGGYVLCSKYDMRRVIYDAFLTYFINNTDLFPHRDTTLTTLAYLDYVPPGSEALYKRSLLYAVEHKTNKLLARDLYYYLGIIKSPFSPFSVYHYEAQSVNLQLLTGTISGQDLKSYYDRVLKQAIILGQLEYPIWPPVEEDNEEETGDEEVTIENPENDLTGETEPPGEESGENTGEDGGEPTPIIPDGEPVEEVVPSISMMKLAVEGETEESEAVKPSIIVPADRIYDEFESAPIKKPTELILTDEDKRQIMLYSDEQKYILNMIIQYMCDTTAQVNFDNVIQVLMTKGKFSYFYGPIIIYILRKTYDKYFIKSTSETD